jgi:rare lipoprotein A
VITLPKPKFNRRSRRLCIRTFAALLVGLLLQACGGSSYYERPQPAPEGYPRPYRVNGQWYQPLPHARDFVQQGIASWYGEDFHGRRTSNGETYDMYAVTAAHKTLPLGTFVRVRNLENGRSVDVRINDRGPFVRGRIIDLSYAAAKQIGLVGPGTARVEIMALGAPAPSQAGGQQPQYVPIDYYSGNFTFQVGAFTERPNADRLIQKLDQLYKNAHLTSYFDGRRTFYRVRVGLATTLDQALHYEQDLIANGYPDTFIVAE